MKVNCPLGTTGHVDTAFNILGFVGLAVGLELRGLALVVPQLRIYATRG